MKLVVNGEETQFDAELNVTRFLTESEVKMPEMVSVELNGQILKRSEFDSIVLADGNKYGGAENAVYSFGSLLQ